MTHEEFFARRTARVNSGRFTELISEYADDAVVHQPFALPEPITMRGREEIARHLAMGEAAPLTMTVRNVKVHETRDPEEPQREATITWTGPDAPEFGEEVNLKPVSGTVLIRLPRGAKVKGKWAHAAQSRFVPLSEVSDGGRLVDEILSAMRVQRVPHADPVTLLAGALQDRPALFILDNFEDLVDSASTTVASLLERLVSGQLGEHLQLLRREWLVRDPRDRLVRHALEPAGEPAERRHLQVLRVLVRALGDQQAQLVAGLVQAVDDAEFGVRPLDAVEREDLVLVGVREQ